MRTTTVVMAVVLLISVAAFAQQPVAQPANRATIYATNVALVSSDYVGNHWSGGATFSYTHFWTPRFATDFAVGAQRSHTGFVAFNRDGSVREKAYNGYTIYPIDVLAQYHFQNETRWKPFVGAGFQYVSRPKLFVGGPSHESAFELDAGVVFNMTKHLGLAFDLRAPIASEDWNDMFRPSAGLAWRF